MTIRPTGPRRYLTSPTAAVTSRRRRHLAGRVAAAAAVFALPVLLAGPARAQIAGLPEAASGSGNSLDTMPTLGGWNVTADGNAVDVLVDNTTGLAGIHPLTEADFPEAQTQFGSGPFGSGLATVFWPGSAGGNFGSLSGELGFPSQLSPLMSKLNDPVKASAQYPSGPASSDYPSGSTGGVAVMHATAHSGGTTADASLANAGPAQILSFSSAKGSSVSSAGKTAQGQASSAVNGVSILGGLIAIGSVTSTAVASSTGAVGSGSAVTHVAEVTVMGQKASIGSDGLVLPQAPGALGPITGPLVQNAIDQVITGLGITVKEFPAIHSGSGSGYTVSAGGVSIEIDPPSSAAPILEQAASTLAPVFPSQAAIIPTLPGLLQGMTITITLGRASASANASPPFNSNFTPTPFPATPGSGSTGGVLGSGSAPVASTQSPTGTGSSPEVAATPQPATASTGGNGTASQAPAVAPAATLIGLSQPLGAGVVVLGILVALAVALGLWRVGRMLLPGDNGPLCPLGQDQP